MEESEPLGAVVCGLLAVGMASWWWAWPLGCGFLLPSTSGGNSVYYLRASVLFSHGSQRARGLSIAATILIPAFTNLWKKKIKAGQMHVGGSVSCYLALGLV